MIDLKEEKNYLRKTWNKFISQAINFIEHQESKILLPASFSKIQ